MAGVATNDPVGKASVGEFFEQHTNIYGSKWQMGIAVSLTNRKFDFGTVIKYTLAADSFGSGSLAVNAHQLGITAAILDPASLPSNYIQHGDKIQLGPSSVTGDEGRSESIRVAAAAQDTPSDITWNTGMVYSIDRLNKYRYSISDPITIYGTGIGFGWEVTNNQQATLGIKKGYSSLGQMGRYSPNKAAAAADEDHIAVWENGLGTDFIGIDIMLPTHASYTKNILSGPDISPSIEHSDLGLAPWRDVTYPEGEVNDDTWDWATSSDANKSIDIKGVFRYMREHSIGAAGAEFARLAFDTDADASGLNLVALNTYASIITGFVHPGGQFKDTAQALMVMGNSLSTGDPRVSIGIFSQKLYRGTNDTRDVSYSKLTPGTYYRLGLTWRGDILPAEPTNVAGSEVFAKFQFGPVTDLSEADAEIAKTFISTNPLLNSSVSSITSYQTDMVTGFVQTIDTDDLDTFDNLRIDVVMNSTSHKVDLYDSRDDRGAEILMFIDNIFLEHEGDIPGATGKGYVEIDHHPEAGTLRVDRFLLAKTVKVSTPTTRQRFDPTGAGDRYLYQIDASFERVTDAVWQQFRALLRWQDLGHKLTLHPFLPSVPHCLVGDLEITSDSRQFWDISRHSFKVRFIETE